MTFETRFPRRARRSLGYLRLSVALRGRAEMPIEFEAKVLDVSSRMS